MNHAFFNNMLRAVRGWFAPFGLRRAAGAVLACLALASAPMLTGCAGVDGDNGEVVIGLTDADGDFLTYSVEVQSLTLTRADDTVVEVLPISTTVDFAEYTTMTEFLTAAMIPNGVYVAADMVLDYSNADIQVEVAGNAVPAAAVDADGNPMGVTTMTVKLEERDHIRIRPGVPAHVVFDFDLAATNQVDVTTDPANPVVTVDPVLLAEVDADFSKPHRLRGLLKEVALDQSEFTLHVRPFRHRQLSDHRFGDFPVAVDGNTAFEIDGMTYTGSAGLAALDAKAPGTPVVAFGKVNRVARHMLATRVRAGSSVPWGEKDVVKGTVIARNGDTLTVRGGAISFNAAGGRPDVFRNQVLVNVDANTVVNGPVGVGTLSIDSLSVGSRITAVGNLVQAVDVIATDALLVPTLNADKVRVHISGLSGTVDAIGSGDLTMGLKAINGREVGLYDFTGTGSDPAAYVVDTGLLDLSALTVGQHIYVRGLVADFGMTPPDFVAMSVTDPAIEPDNRGTMVIHWNPAKANPLLRQGADGMVPDLTGSPYRHHVLQRSGITDLTTLTTDPVIAPTASGEGRYAIQVRGGVRIYPLFDEFQVALADLVDGGAKARTLIAHGEWSADSATLTAKVITINLKTAVGQPTPIDPSYVRPMVLNPGRPMPVPVP